MIKLDIPMVKMNLKQTVINWTIAIFSKMSLSTIHRIGKIIGYLGSHIPNRVRTVAKINIKRCFPEMNQAEQKHLLHACFQHMAQSLLEVPLFWKLPQEKLLPLIKKTTGEAEFENVIKSNKGMIFLGAHMGAEELLNAYLSPKYPATWIYRPQKGYLETFIHQARERFGSQFVPTTTLGVKALYKSLLNNQPIGMSCDHNAPEQSGVYAPFFGITTWTMTLAIRFAQKTKIPVYFIHAERLANAEGFHIHFIPVGPEIYDQNEIIAATEMNRVLESCIRQHPEQYQWGYKRFRRRPSTEPNFY